MSLADLDSIFFASNFHMQHAYDMPITQIVLSKLNLKLASNCCDKAVYVNGTRVKS